MTKEELNEAAGEYFIERYGHLDYQSPEVTVHALVNFHLHQIKGALGKLQRLKKNCEDSFDAELPGSRLAEKYLAKCSAYDTAIRILKQLEQ